MQSVGDGHVEWELPGNGLEDPVEVVGRHPADHPAHQEALDVRHRTGRVRGVEVPPLAPVEQQHQRGIGDLGLPGVQAVQLGADRCFRLLLGVQQTAEESGAAVQLPDVGLDVLLGRLAALEALLLSRVEVLAAHPVVAVEDQLQPHELFQLFVAQTGLQRQPVRLVDMLTAGGQLHEQVVAQQVRLAELEPGVVQGLEDAVHVVPALGGHRHQRQPGGDGLLDAEHVLRGGGIGRLDQLAAEEGVGRCDTAAGDLFRERAADVRGELRPVRLGRQQPEVVTAVLPLVDQVLLVDALGITRLGVPDVIADRGQGEGECGQPLLAVDDKPARERRIVLRRRREDDGPQEMRVRLLAALDQLGLLQDVAPQLLELLIRPGVRPLVERHLELLGPPLHEIGEQRLLRLHRGPPLAVDAVVARGNDHRASRLQPRKCFSSRPTRAPQRVGAMLTGRPVRGALAARRGPRTDDISRRRVAVVRPEPSARLRPWERLSSGRAGLADRLVGDQQAACRASTSSVLGLRWVALRAERSETSPAMARWVSV